MTHRRVAFITGAGSANGIGFHTATLLAEAGYTVLLAGHSDRVYDRARELQASGYQAESFSGDLTDHTTRSELLSWVRGHTDTLHVLVINHGMPEVGNMPIPKKLLDQGVRDMVRISDARMSGTAYGTVVLHVSPEAAAGGPLAYVQTGDSITLDVKNRSLTLHVPDHELQARSQSPVAEDAYAKPARGWAKLYVDHVLQADKGADLDFLLGGSGHDVARESH